MPIAIHVMQTLKADVARVYIYMIQEYLEDILVQIDTSTCTYKIQEDCYTNDHLLL